MGIKQWHLESIVKAAVIKSTCMTENNWPHEMTRKEEWESQRHFSSENT